MSPKTGSGSRDWNRTYESCTILVPFTTYLQPAIFGWINFWITSSRTKQSLKFYTLWWKLSLSESVAIPRVATTITDITSDTTIIGSSANIRTHYQPSQTHNSLGNMNDVVRVAVHHHTEALDLVTPLSRSRNHLDLNHHTTFTEGWHTSQGQGAS